jgi:chromosome segregation ATPase
MNTVAIPPPRTAAALAARRVTGQQRVQRVQLTIERMRREHTPVTVAALARRADVSRTFLYANPDARAALTAATADAEHRKRSAATTEHEQIQTSWRERALNAEHGLTTAHTEIRNQRTRIGELLGQIRDLQAEWTDEAIERITTENTNLKQRVRQLTQDNRTLEERLAAARSTLRFQDRRLADLEARLTDMPMA